jgi:8-oxo-dGTP diphosphatase
MPAEDIKREHESQNIKLAVDCSIFTVINSELNILLIKMKEKFEGSWALPGGLVNDHETTDIAAKRILNSQTSVKDVYLEQLYTFSDISRDPSDRVVSVAYFALIPAENINLKTTEKYSDVSWWSVKDMPKLAYDHTKIAKYSQKRLKWKISYTNAAWSLLPSEFTLSQLQGVYESILEKTIDKRNFRKKILSLEIIESTDKTSLSGAHRPAKLYRFISKTPDIIDIM